MMPATPEIAAEAVARVMARRKAALAQQAPAMRTLLYEAVRADPRTFDLPEWQQRVRDLMEEPRDNGTMWIDPWPT